MQSRKVPLDKKTFSWLLNSERPSSKKVFFLEFPPQLGKGKHTPPCSSEELVFAEKNWGPQRKDFGGRYGFPEFYRGRCFHHRPGKFFFEPRKLPQKIFFRWWSCMLFLLCPGTIPTHAGKQLFGNYFFLRIHVGPGFATRANTENRFEESFSAYLRHVLGGTHFGANTCRICVCTHTNTGNTSWRIIYVLVSCQGAV